MSKLPDSLAKIRNALANQHAYHPIQDNHASINYGFDACYTELLPVIEEIRKALFNSIREVDAMYDSGIGIGARDSWREALAAAEKILGEKK